QLRDVESTHAGACAHQTRGLVAFEQTAREQQIVIRPAIESRLTALYDTLLEQNLLRIVIPQLVSEIECVAQ
ncbi:hypothetical protein BJV77DRAFT_913651, partial [Russula vinacea]